MIRNTYRPSPTEGYGRSPEDRGQVARYSANPTRGDGPSGG